MKNLMPANRVVITGLGVFSPIGKNYPDFWYALCAGQCGIAPINQINCKALRFKQGAEIKQYDPQSYFDSKKLLYLDRFTQFALIAAKEAVLDAKLTTLELATHQTVIVTGSCMGGKLTEDQGFYRLYHDKKQSVNPASIPMAMANAPASQIALTYGITGPTYTLSTACASSTHAIGQAYWLIKQGIAKHAIAGGSEASFSVGQLKAWEAMRIISSDTCRPFSKERKGMILGEGAAMLILESLESAKSRGAEIYAEITGFGMSNDASHLTDPNSAGQQQAIQFAITEAKLATTDINYINAHGTGTELNDRIEARTITELFSNSSDLLVSSTKAAHGHLLGAAGAIESVATILAIKNSIVPPTINYLGADVNCDLPLVTHLSKKKEINFALKNSFAFGGLNATLIFAKYN